MEEEKKNHHINFQLRLPQELHLEDRQDLRQVHRDGNEGEETDGGTQVRSVELDCKHVPNCDDRMLLQSQRFGEKLDGKHVSVFVADLVNDVSAQLKVRISSI